MSDLFTIDQPEPEDVEEPRKSIWRGEAVRLIAVIAAALIVLGGWVLWRKSNGNITQWTPAVGDCVTAAASDEDVERMKAVDCADSQAASKVIGVYQDRDSNDVGSYKDPCANVPGWDQEVFYGTQHKGFILCLKSTR